MPFFIILSDVNLESMVSTLLTPVPPHNSCVHVRLQCCFWDLSFHALCGRKTIKGGPRREGGASKLQVPRLEEIKVDLSPAMHLYLCLYLFRQYQVTILWSIWGQTKFCGDLLCLKQTRNLIMIPICFTILYGSTLALPQKRCGRELNRINTCTDQFLPIPSTKLIKQRLRSWNTNNETVSLFKHLFPKKLFPAAFSSLPMFPPAPPPKQNTLPKTTTEPQYGSKLQDFFFRGMIVRFQP